MAKKSAEKSSSDDVTKTLIAEVVKRKQEIADADRPNWKTNCLFSFTGSGTTGATNLHVESDVGTLIRIAAFVRAQDDYYDNMTREMQIENAPPFKWMGFSAADWIEDVKTRLSKVQIASKRKKLEDLERRLNTIISPALRAEMEQELIMKELGIDGTGK